MKLFLFSLLALVVGLLGACATTANLSPIQVASQKCSEYQAVQSTTLALKQAGKLTAAQLAKYKQADAAATLACNQPPPMTAASEAEWSANMDTQIAVLSAINHQGAK